MKIAMIVIGVIVAGLAPAEKSAPSPTGTLPSMAVRFGFVDVMIDPKDQPLAAYQVEFAAPSAQVKLVGIEGGDHAAYKQPPYYDPAALSQNRVILAAFNARADLPRAKFRAARLHLQITGDDQPSWQVKPLAAASDKSDSIAIDVSLWAEGAKR